jgi:hypothetical protein
MFLLLTSTASANACTDKFCTGQIKRLYVHGGVENVFIDVDADKGPLTCTLSGNRYLVLRKTNGLFDATYSLLLSAHIARLPVTLRMNTNSNECTVQYVTLDQ